MAREVLGGPSDAGRASYQIAISVSEESRSYGHAVREMLGSVLERVTMARRYGGRARAGRATRGEGVTPSQASYVHVFNKARIAETSEQSLRP